MSLLQRRDHLLPHIANQLFQLPHLRPQGFFGGTEAAEWNRQYKALIDTVEDARKNGYRMA